MISQALLCSRVLLKYEKHRESSDVDIRREGGVPPSLVLARELYSFKLVITINQNIVFRL